VKQIRLTRREIVENCIGKGLLLSAIPLSQVQLLSAWEEGMAKAAKPTPREVLGPFYKKGAPNQRSLHVPGTPGFPLRVTGKVTNTRGEKVPGAKVEIWQADHAGYYDLEGFRYRAALLIDSASDYAVDTILPGHYDDRPAQHIHYMISAPGHKTLVTQAYFATDPFFDGNPDKNYTKRNMVSDRELVRTVTLIEAPGTPRASITFDICLEKA
jgi:protocatechuate 3,4-dioxygenase beta subunit